MKRAIIVHCWEGYPEYCWYPWVKKELENRGFHVEVPAFPDIELPEMGKWIPKLQEVISRPDEELYLIGHSIGCATIMRYLETLEEDQKIGGLVMVAGFSEDIGYDEIKSFFETSIDLEKIKTKVKNGTVVIHSDNDPHVDLKHADIFKKRLGAEVIMIPGAEHFSGTIEGENACLELPAVIEGIDRLVKKSVQ